MSRYVLNPKVPDVQVAVGWDPPFSTFFVYVVSTTVIDYRDDAPEVFLLLGATADTMIFDLETLKRRVRLFANIPDDIERQLRVDSD